MRIIATVERWMGALRGVWRELADRPSFPVTTALQKDMEAMRKRPRIPPPGAWTPPESPTEYRKRLGDPLVIVCDPSGKIIEIAEATHQVTFRRVVLDPDGPFPFCHPVKGTHFCVRCWRDIHKAVGACPTISRNLRWRVDYDLH